MFEGNIEGKLHDGFKGPILSIEKHVPVPLLGGCQQPSASASVETGLDWGLREELVCFRLPCGAHGDGANVDDRVASMRARMV